jgi:photosystem II stability/assembly factor-like uncharacterized protein
VSTLHEQTATPIWRPTRRAWALGLCGLLQGTARAAGFKHPIDVPAAASALAARAPLLDVQRAGARFVAVGRRGHIVYSDDSGATWRQASVPVSVDLVGVDFPNAEVGWAVGHEGVVLATRDGGTTWAKQLAGATTAGAVAQPFLGVRFQSATCGFVVGAFNTIYRTQDAGRTWTPWMDRTANPAELHFYAVRGGRDHLYLAGEQGRVWRLRAGAEAFVPVPTPYTGTLFGLVAGPADAVLAFGMRGAVYRSTDAGANWHRVTMPTGAGVTAGTTLDDSRIVLVDQGGGIHISRDGGRTFGAAGLRHSTPCHGVAAGSRGTLVLTGPDGARTVCIP